MAVSAASVPPVPNPYRMTGTFRLLVRGKNVNAETLLSTDYLNHFNEIAMLIEMAPSMPECLDDIRAWRPKTYAEHFHDSNFADRDLAILAYDNAPSQHREPFDRTIERMNEAVAAAVRELGAAIEAGAPERIEAVAQSAARRLHALIDVASGIINGHHAVIHQHQIDAILEGVEGAARPATTAGQ